VKGEKTLRIHFILTFLLKRRDLEQSLSCFDEKGA
jgi:hypothetical protein